MKIASYLILLLTSILIACGGGGGGGSSSSSSLPSVKVNGVLDKQNKELKNEWRGVNSVIAELPLNLTLPQALKQLRKQLADYQFSAALPKQTAPLYQLSNSKLRIDTLQNGLTALRLYKKGLPLWKIGNHLRQSQNHISVKQGDHLGLKSKTPLKRKLN